VGPTVGLDKTVSGPNRNFGHNSQWAKQNDLARNLVGPTVVLGKRLSGPNSRFGQDSQWAQQ
jgi:hypothetical protein